MCFALLNRRMASGLRRPQNGIPVNRYVGSATEGSGGAKRVSTSYSASIEAKNIKGELVR